MTENYLTYQAADFATDAAFIRWVRDKDPEHSEAWRQWSEAHPNLQAEILAARQLVLATTTIKPVNSKINTQNLWDRIETSLENIEEEAPVAKRRSLVRYIIPLAAAAAIALLILLNLGETATELSTGKADMLVQVLPDQSQIELNAESYVKFSEKGFEKKRELFLKGEAFFEVEKGQDFVVKTDLGQVKVLGTSFNVYTRGDEFEVQCVTGKVEVSKKDGSGSVILTPGQSAKLVDRDLNADSFELAKAAGWRSDTLYFGGESLRRVFDELERQFDVSIESPIEYDTEGFSGYFLKKAKIETNLEAICGALGLTYETQGQTIIISSMDATP